METSPSSPETTLAVLLGASTFPGSPQLEPNAAFKRSADSFAAYLVDRNGFGLPTSNLLNLFDSPEPVIDQDSKIGSFLKQRLENLANVKMAASDLIVYYVGHGGFFDPGTQYFLALHGTTEDKESISGYPFQSLAITLKFGFRTFRDGRISM